MSGKVIVDPPDGKIPYQPWALERANNLRKDYGNPSAPANMDPVSRCFMEGVPRIMYQGEIGRAHV